MRYLFIAALTFVAVSTASAQQRGTRFWNLTRYTITAFHLSLSGQNDWGPNQCKNDRDGEVDHDERLRITNIKTGRYDAKFSDKGGRMCVIRQIDIKDGEIFTIEEKQALDCQTR